MTRRFLVPLDGSGEDESILAEARRVLPSDGEIHLLHVVPPFAPPVGMEPTHRLGFEEKAGAYLDEVRRRMPLVKGLNVLRNGRAAEGIIQVSLELNIDVIAMCTRARRGLSHLLLGSVAEEVVRKSWLPVLLARPGAPPPERELRRILVPLDGTGASEEILRTVAPLAARTGAEVLLLHVAPRVPDPAPQWAFPGPLRLLETPLGRLEGLADGLERDCVVAEPVMAYGDPKEEIPRQAAALAADWVAMTTHCRTGLEKAIVGSVAQSVLRAIDRPVLLARPVARRHP